VNSEQRALVRRLRSQGWSLRAIAQQVSCGHADIDVMLRGQAREARPMTWVPRLGGLTIEEREEIPCGLSRGDSLSGIARQLRRSPSTTLQKVGANRGRELYRF
jgi:IS30 family transposase